jgi:hypothetical protein
MIKIKEIQSDLTGYYISMRDNINNLFGVFDATNCRLNRKTKKYNYEMMPSNRTDKWIKDHSFTFKEAMAILEKKEKEYNNKTVKVL